jgi:hypothetical protein
MWSALTLLHLLMCVILPVWKEGQARISANRCMFSQCPGAANTDGILAAEANTK